MHIKTRILPLVWIALLFTGSSCKSKTQESTEAEASIAEGQIAITRDQFTSSAMATATLSDYEFTEVVNANGVVGLPPQGKAIISAVIPGHIVSSSLLPGDMVKKGQVLASIESPEYIQIQQDYANAVSQLTYLKEEYDRQKSLTEENIASRKVFSKAESDYLIMKVTSEGLKKKLQMLSIDPEAVVEGTISSRVNLYSPINGHVSVQNTTTGMFASPGDVLLEVIDNSHLHLELNIFEADAMKVKTGQKLHFRPIQGGTDYFEAEVIMVSKSIEGAERLITVHAHIMDQENINLIPGMYVEAGIMVNRRKSVGLPEEAIVNTGGQSFIFVVKAETPDEIVFEKRYVDLGATSEGMTEVLCKNDSCTVLIKGAFNLAEGF